MMILSCVFFVSMYQCCDDVFLRHLSFFNFHQPLKPEQAEIAAARWAPLAEVFAFKHLQHWLPHLQVFHIIFSLPRLSFCLISFHSPIG